MDVTEIMTSPVLTVESDVTLRDAVEVMLDHHVGSVLVVDGGLEGILTRTDVLRAGYDTQRPFGALSVTAHMSADVVTTNASTSIETALRQMAEHTVKRLPVVDGIDIVGIVTLTDIARHLPDRVRETRHALDDRDEWAG